MKHKNLLFLSLFLSNVLFSIEKSPYDIVYREDLEIITPACKEDLKKFISKISKAI